MLTAANNKRDPATLFNAMKWSSPTSASGKPLYATDGLEGAASSGASTGGSPVPSRVMRMSDFIPPLFSMISEYQ